MSWFMVETYAPRDGDLEAPRVADVALAANQVSEDGAKVRLIRAIFVAEDETCFYLYESSSAAAVRKAVTRAGLPCARIAEAVSTAPPNAHNQTP